MLVRTKERSYRCQTKHLFPKNRPTEVCQDQKEEAGKGQHRREENGSNQKVRGRFTEAEGCSDQKGVPEGQELQAKIKGQVTNQVKDCQAKKIVSLLVRYHHP